MPKQILYIGNHLSTQGKYPSVGEAMQPLMLPEVALHLVSPIKNKFLRMLDMAFSVLKCGRSQQPVLIDVYSTTNFYYAFLVAILCRALFVKYLPILHGGNLPHRLAKNPWMCRVICSAATVNIAPSQYLAEHFIKAGFKTTVIPNFIHIQNYDFKLRDKAILPHESLNLLWVRAFDALYNPDMAVEIVLILKQTYPNIKLQMVGPDKDGSMGRCQALVKKYALEQHVFFLGLLSKPEWRQISQESHIFFNTTNFDNMPVSVVEAMALGIPVVSTNVGGMPYLITQNENGVLVPPGNALAMVDAILKVAGSGALSKELSHNGRMLAENLDWSRVKQLWISNINAVKISQNHFNHSL
jgi:glycosyltransferase involved in cell wall biosynthesis